MTIKNEITVLEAEPEKQNQQNTVDAAALSQPPLSALRETSTGDQQEFPKLVALIAASSSLPARPRNGKIAALPLEVRDRVNEMLRAGCSYSDIAHRLGTWGYSGISPANISNWKYGGFAVWLQQQQQTEARLTLPHALERSARSVDLDRLQQNAVLSACNQLSVILAKFDPDRALNLLYQRPQLLPAFIGALAALGRCTRDLTRTFELVHQRETAIREQLENIAHPAPSSTCHCQTNGNGKPDVGKERGSPDQEPKSQPALTHYNRL